MKKKIRKRRKYSQEFKREAVSLVEDQGYTKAEAGRSLGIRPELIRRWTREFQEEGIHAFPGNGKLTPDQQRIRELEAENRRLKMEKDVLKKATTILTEGVTSQPGVSCGKPGPNSSAQTSSNKSEIRSRPVQLR